MFPTTSAGFVLSSPTRGRVASRGVTPVAGVARRPPRRLVRSAAWEAAVLALLGAGTGVTWSLFNSTVPGSASSFTSGTISLSAGSATGTCTTASGLPDGTTKTCSLQVTYTGAQQAWMGLDVFVATKPGTGGSAENLYNPGAGDNPTTFTVSDNQTSPVTYTLPTSALSSCPNAASSINGTDYSAYNKCYLNSDLLVNTAAFSSNTSVTFSIAITIPTNNGTNYQGGSAAVVIRPRAVQIANNGSTSTCTAGSACPGVTAWS